MSNEEYIKTGGLVRPFCGCESLKGGFVEVDAGKAFQTVRCGNCQNKWEDVYELVDMIKGREECC